MADNQETAAEFMKRLRSNPEWVKRDEERKRKRAEARARRLREQAHLIQDLREVGVEVESVWDLVNTTNYPEAIPVLVRHLKKDYDPRTREGIARALGEPEARRYLPEIFDAFEWDSDTKLNGPKWALGNTIRILADRSYLDRIIALALDEKHGAARSMLVQALGKWESESGAAKLTLDKLASDEDVKFDVQAARKASL